MSSGLELGQYRTGDLIMKKLLLATTAFVVLAVGSASAADLRPAYKAAPPPPPMYSWTGLYWGVNVGYSWGRDKNEWNLIGFGTVSRVAEDGRRHRRLPVRLQLSVRPMGARPRDRHPGVGPEGQHDLRHRARRHAERRPQAAVVRNLAHAPGRPGVADGPALRHGRCGLWPGQAGLHARRGRSSAPRPRASRTCGPAGLPAPVSKG